MTRVQVPEADHVACYRAGSKVHEDGRIDGAAFRLRGERAEEYLSVNWLEILGIADRTAQVNEILRILAKKLNIRPAARLAVLNVGCVRNYVRAESPDGRLLHVLHVLEPEDPSHSGIFDLPADDDNAAIVGDLIADVVQETYPANPA